MVEVRTCLELEIMEVMSSGKGVLKRSNHAIARDMEQVQHKPRKNQSKTEIYGGNRGTQGPLEGAVGCAERQFLIPGRMNQPRESKQGVPCGSAGEETGNARQNKVSSNNK